MSSLTIERARPSPRHLAHVPVAKYGDHRWLYRQGELCAVRVWTPPPCTLPELVGR